MNGDILTLIDFGKLYSFALEMNCPLTISIKKEITPFAFGNILFDGDYVSFIEEKPDLVNYILAGIYVMTPKVFDSIPYDTPYGMDNLIQKYLKENTKVAKYEMNEYLLDIGRLNDYEKAQDVYKTHFCEEE